MKRRERKDAAGAVTIARTKDPADFRRCARFMAASEPWITLGLDYRACLKAPSDPLREVYAARRDGKPAGFVILQMTGAFKGYISTLCVAPAERGAGLGALLMGFAERRILGEAPNVFLCVSSFNHGARRFYRRLGYRRVGVLKDFIVKGLDELLLRKTNGPLTGAKTKRP